MGHIGLCDSQKFVVANASPMPVGEGWKWGIFKKQGTPGIGHCISKTRYATFDIEFDPYSIVNGGLSCFKSIL